MAPSLTMSAADNEKPPRAYTAYNIFFQLERAYILQVILHTQPTHDDAIFHPSQPTYAGLPRLPRRYASLTLAYDWHLTGKEKRRKTRKHRKSHGAIGFHELSNRIAKAWKCVDEDVKRYCEQVHAVGMAAHKVKVKEWKRKKQHQRMLSKELVKSKSLMKQAPKEINTSIIRGEANNLKDMLLIKDAQDTDTSRSEEAAPKTLHEEIHVQDMTHCHDPMSRNEKSPLRRYCEQVCVVGMAPHKIMMKEWKRNKQHRRMLSKEMVRSESLMIPAPEEVNSSIIQGEANNLKDMLPIKGARDADTSLSEEAAPKTPCEDIHVQGMTQCYHSMSRSEEALPKALCEDARVKDQDMAAQSYHSHGDEVVTPNPVQSNDGAMIMDESNGPSSSQYDPNRNEALAQAQDNYSPQSVALTNLSNEEILNMWDAQESPSLRTLGPVAPAFCSDAVMGGEGISKKKDVEEGRTEAISNSSSFVSSKPIDVKEIFDKVYCYECMPTINGGTANEFSQNDTGDGKKSDVKRKSNLPLVSSNEPTDNVGGKAISNKQDSGNIDAKNYGQLCYECTPQEMIWYIQTQNMNEKQRMRKIMMEERMRQELERIERQIGCETEYDRGKF